MFTRKIQLIGRETHISLEDYGLYDLPAKVDTGADSSAIWASDIKVENKVLSFKLLGPNSPYYSGKTIKTKEYKFYKINNSFGHIEKRYAVYLRVRINGRRIRARFTLANRSTKKYPVLIGRRLLRNKFLVHVSFNHKKHNSDLFKEVIL